MPIALGVDIGGSHITAGWVDLNKGKVLGGSVQRKLIDSGEGAAEIISGWCGLIQSCIKEKLHDNIKIGIAIPGPFDYTDGISLMKEQDKFQSLYGMNVRSVLSEQLLLPPESFLFLNDAEAYLRGEVMGGEGRGYQQVLGLTLGTGLGSAIHSNGQTRDADLWNSPFKEGIAEDYLCTQWFVQRYCALAAKQEAGLKEIIETGKPEILHKLFSEFTQSLCGFLVPLSKEHGFEAIVLGGNISQAHKLFFPSLKRLLKHQEIKAKVLLGMLKEEALLIGAASQWKATFQGRKFIEAAYE